MNQPKRILITGGAGFIGARLASVLRERGADVTIFDIHLEKKRSVLETLCSQINCIEGDVKDKEAIFDSVEGKDIVVHLAAGASFLMYEENPLYETANVMEGFLNVLEAVKQFKIEKLVYASSSAVYEGNSLPYRETMDIHPPDHKALAKKVNEEFAALYSKRYGVKAVGLRPYSVYGPGEAHKAGFANAISLFAWAMLGGNTPVVWGDGNQTRDFIFVDDLVDMIYTCIVREINVPVINAGTGVETSFNEVINIIQGYLNSKFEPIYVPVPVDVYATRLLADTTLQGENGLIAKIDVREGIKRVIESALAMEKSRQLSLANAQMYYASVVDEAFLEVAS